MSTTFRVAASVRCLSLGCLIAGCAVAGATNEPAAAARDSAQAAQVHASGYTLRETEAPPAEAAQAAVASPLVMRGRGTNARIVDAAGNAVWCAPGEMPLYGLRASPDGRRVVTYAGDANSSVRPVDDLDAARPLPTHPDVPGATGFGQWYWLDAQRLLGVSELPAAGDETGLTAAERESRAPTATLLAVFDLRDGTLRNVDVADGLPRVFLVETVQGVHIQLSDEGAGTTAWSELVGVPH
ncbi:hypothetical protein [Luteimonas lutimaris]